MKKQKTKESLISKNIDGEIGLNNEQVEERIKKGYQNISTKSYEKSTLGIICSNTFTFFNCILLVIAAIFLGFIIFLHVSGNEEVINKHFGFSKFAFLLPALMNVVFGTIQELNSRRTIRKLKIVTESKVNVLRNGEVLNIPSNQVVLDDIIMLKAGDQATADLEVLSGEVSVDESILTGESDYVKKHKGDKILSGSSIIVGDAKTKVVQVGDDTYASKLSQKVKSGARHKSELMDSIVKIIRFLAIMLGVLAVTIIGTLIYKISVHGNNPEVWDGMTLSLTDPVTWARIMVTVGSFGIGVIPAGLMLTTSVAMMISIVGLSKKQTLVQELYSLENLSRVDVICLDKTGTLTDGTMNVCDVKMYEHLEIIVEHIQNLLASQPSKNQTALALFNKFGSAENVEYSEIIPFSSQTKYSGLVYKNGDRLIMGAPEYLLEKGDEKLKVVEEQAKQGKRVIAMKLNDKLLCFFVLEDHIRDSAKDTLKFFRENNVEVKVISGDNALTVSKIAEKCGIKNYDKYISLEGIELDKIKDIADKYTIFARVSPEQKEALVEALQAKGHKVAMTGDGVNDILALRKAQASISFANATEAAKSCADVILLDNDFSHLKDVVGEGRRVINNIQNLSILFLMKSIAIMITCFVSIAFKKGQMWYSVENAYMLEATSIGTGGFLLSFNNDNKSPVQGSFIKNIRIKAVAAGALAALAICIPIMLYTIPTFYGHDPIVKATNVKAMITILLTTAGLVVLLSLCVPFNKYKAFAFFATLFVVFVLSNVFPTAYIGGHPISADLFNYNKTLGENIYDSQFFSEIFRPWNSPIIQNLFADSSTFIVFGVFVLVGFPLFYMNLRLIDNFIKTEYNRELFKQRIKEKFRKKRA